MTSPRRVHFMGIGGSGMSAVAQIAAAAGFSVSGCDLQADTPYLDKIRQAKIPVTLGHDLSHLDRTDLLCVTPAAFFLSARHPELTAAKDRGILLTWQEFLGRYLHQGKNLICVAGTHGKSTTTALAGLLLQLAGLDPIVEVGATVREWHSNVRLGQGDYFVSEADEYYHNFLHYHPQTIILNNIEMDHPEYFGDLERLIDAYRQFLSHLPPEGNLIFNADSPIVAALAKELPSHIHLFSYSLSQVSALSPAAAGTAFRFLGHDYLLSLPGLHNVQNALGIILLADILAIPYSITARVLTDFTGLGRRVELLGEVRGIRVYDDYANHPTAFSATLSAVRQLNPAARIFTVIEPHTYSRLRILLPQLPASLTQAAEVLVTPIFASREQDPGDFSSQTIVDYLNKSQPQPLARFLESFDAVTTYLGQVTQPGDCIVVMGSGNSYLLSRQILNALTG